RHQFGRECDRKSHGDRRGPRRLPAYERHDQRHCRRRSDRCNLRAPWGSGSSHRVGVAARPRPEHGRVSGDAPGRATRARVRRWRWLVGAVDTAVVVVVALLAVVIVGAVVWVVKTFKTLGPGALTKAMTAQDESAYLAEKDHQEQSLAALRGAADDA